MCGSHEFHLRTAEIKNNCQTIPWDQWSFSRQSSQRVLPHLKSCWLAGGEMELEKNKNIKTFFLQISLHLFLRYLEYFDSFTLRTEKGQTFLWSWVIRHLSAAWIVHPFTLTWIFKIWVDWVQFMLCMEMVKLLRDVLVKPHFSLVSRI